MWSIEFTSFFTGVGCEHTDEVLINEAKHIVALLAVHRDILDELDELTDCLGLRGCAVAELRKTGLECVKDTGINMLIVFTD